MTLILGSQGQLGQSLAMFKGHDPNFLWTDRDTLDITSSAALELFFKRYPITAIINAAAYTAVDRAEEEKELAYALNAEAPKLLASLCEKRNIPLFHISTDYVFDGTASRPYHEESPTNPLGVYGQSKYAGERYVLAYPMACVIRTSWLYSPFGNNFVKTILSRIESPQGLQVVCDQIGSPTSALDLARFLLSLHEQSQKDPSSFPFGLYHYSNQGVASWYDFAVAIRKLCGSKNTVKAIPTGHFPSRAVRPSYSVLSKEKIENTFKTDVPHWMESLELVIKHLQQEKGEQSK